MNFSMDTYLYNLKYVRDACFEVSSKNHKFGTENQDILLQNVLIFSRNFFGEYFRRQLSMLNLGIIVLGLRSRECCMHDAARLNFP